MANTYDEAGYTYDDAQSQYENLSAAPFPPSPLPTMQYLVAFQNNAFDDPGLIASVAAPGVLGGNNVWTDITSHVKQHNISRGRQHELNRFESGTCTLDVRNDDGQFCPWNTQGPYYGFLNPMKPMQVRATYAGVTYKRFTGLVSAWPVMWPDNFSSLAQVQATDAFRALALANITNSQYSQAVIADSPVTYYRLGDSDAYARDAASGRTGQYVGTGTQGITGALTTDPNLAFDCGNYAGYVELPGAIAGFGNVFSFECWAQFHAQPSAGPVDHLFSEANVTHGPGATNFAVIGPYAGSGSNLGIFVALNDGTHAQTYQTNAVLPIAGDNKWHHIVATRTGATFKIYLDGVSQTVVQITDTGNVVLAGIVGATLGGSITNQAGALNGAMDEAAVYNAVLTPARVLAHYQAGSLPSVLSGARVNKILDVVGWSSGARNIDAGDTTVQLQSSSLVTTKALTHLQTVEQTEDGALFMTGDGKVRFVARSSILSSPLNTSQTTYGDSVPNSEVTFEANPDLALDELDLFNEGSVQNTGGILQVYSDATSVATYGRRTLSLSGLVGPNDAYALQRAQWLVARFKTPVIRMRKMDHRPLDNPASFFPIALGRELLDRVTVIRHGVPAVGVASTDPLVIQANVEHIDETVNAGDWTISYALANALPPAGLWNDAVYGRWSDTSPLNATITAGATTLVVTIATGAPSWTTSAGDLPFTIQVDVEQMTVTAVSALSGGTQTLTVTRGVNNTVANPHTAGAGVTPFPACVYSF